MQTLRFIHRWLGIVLALPLLVQGLSGAILTLEPVLPSFASYGPATAAVSANMMLDVARRIVPADMRPSRYMPPEEPSSPVQVQFAPEGRPRGPGVVVSLDPATAAPLGPAVPSSGVMEWIKRLHTNFLVPEWGGRQIAGWFGVGLLALSVLGIPLWWPSSAQRGPGRWRNGFTVPRNARGVRLHRRLHGAMGIWLWVMMVATSTTGIVQGFPQTSRAVLGVAGGRPPGAPNEGRNGPGARPAASPQPAPDLDAAIRLALEAVPGARLRMAVLPAGPAEPLRLIVGPPGTDGVTSATTVLVDPAGMKIRSIQSPAQASSGETVLRWAHDLHFGQGFGPVWRGLTVLVGMALPAFGVTGVTLWMLKRRNQRRLTDMKEAAMQASQAGE